MKLNTTLTAALLLFWLIGSARAYQDMGITALKSADGILLVWNQPNDYFTVEIKGKEIRPLNSTEHVFFNVDGIPLQVQSVAVSEFLKEVGKAERSPGAILAAHKDWESQFIESSLGQKLNVHSSALKLKGGGEALFWKFDMPKGFGGDAKQQLYLTIVNGQNVLLLNGVVTGEQKEDSVRQLLVGTMETLKQSHKPISVRELQESMRGGAPR